MSMDPVKPGSSAEGIKSPMCSENIGRKSAPTTHKYKGMPSADKSGSSIKGPGNVNAWKK